ncbi:hypothetical protein PRIPAC_93706, partial [Pristionchus pacificus]
HSANNLACRNLNKSRTQLTKDSGLEMDLTSPRRSSRNHASTLALDVAMSMTSSLKDGENGGGGEMMVMGERKKGPRDSSASSSTSKRSSVKKGGEKKREDTRGKRRAGPPPSEGKRRRKRSETEEEESSEEDENDLEEELVEQKPPQGNDSFSVSRLIGEGDPFKDGTKRLDIPDDDALPFPSSVLFCEDALGKVDASQYPPNCTQFNIGGTKYLPLSCLMDDDGFTVSISERVSYTKTNGKKHTASLSEALKNSGLTVKRRILGKELLHVLRIAGLVVHWAFVGQLSPPLLKKLQQERDKARKTHESMLAQYAQLQQQTASEEVVKKTVAELIEDRKRRSGQIASEGGTGGGGGTGLLSGISFTGSASYAPSHPSSSSALLSTPISSTIFPVRDYRPRSAGLDALARAADVHREGGITVADMMLQQMHLQQAQQHGGGGVRRESYDPHHTHPSSAAGVPLRISDPEHLNKFIGLLNGDKEGSPLSQPTGSNDYQHHSTFADFDHCPSLSVTEKILLISDFDGGIPEHQLAAKYRIPIEKIPGIIRLRVPLIREQTRVFMERRRMRVPASIRALPVRRTNFVGLNIMMWRFFKDCRDRGIALTGRQLKEHAMTIANQLGLTNFKGSEGWLDAFKRRHKIDLRTMTGEAVNYESDPDGNIICTSADGADDDDCSYDETTRSSSSPTAGDNPTDQLLASVTALVNNETPVQLQLQMGGEDEGRAEGGRLASGGGGLGSSGLQAFQPNYDDPRMAPDFRIDESSLITNIIRSTAVFVPNQEVARALDVLRSYIVTHDPAAIGFFVDLQTRLAASIGAHQTLENCAALGEAGSSGGVGLLNGVGGMNDQADQKTPPMVDGEPKEESAESSETSGEKEEKENKEKEKTEENAAASENGVVNSSHDSTTSEDSNED